MDWLGGVAVVIVLVLIGPVALFVAGGVWSAIVGFLSTDDAERRYEGSEYVKARSW